MSQVWSEVLYYNYCCNKLTTNCKMHTSLFPYKTNCSYYFQNATHKDHAAVAYCVISPFVIILTLEHWVETKRNLLPNASVEPLHLVVACVKHTMLKRSGSGHWKGIRLNRRSQSQLKGVLFSPVYTPSVQWRVLYSKTCIPSTSGDGLPWGSMMCAEHFWPPILSLP